MLALHTTTPLWRDLAPGSKGPDVNGLQRTLSSLGYDVAIDGNFGSETATAIGQLRVDTGATDGATRDDGALAVRDLLWLPDPAVEIAGCPATVGQKVVEGDALFDAVDQLVGLRPSQVPRDLVPGERVLVFDGASLALDPSYAVVEADLRRAAETEMFSLWVDTEQATPLSGSLMLADPIDVLSMDPGALIDAGGARDVCFETSDGELVRGKLMGSQLGASFVQVAEARQVEVSLRPEASSC